jgi:hypothetical protein
MTILTVKHFASEHWGLIAILLLILLVGFAIHNLIDNIFLKPRRKREAKRLKEMEDAINLERQQQAQKIEEERKVELKSLLDRLKENDEIYETHYNILLNNWSSWDSEKINQQIKSSVAKLETEKELSQRRVSFETRIKEELVNERITQEVFNSLSNSIESIDLSKLTDELEREISKLERRRALIGKYGENDGARISNGEFWLGMSEHQLVESIGNPTLIEREVLKTKVKIIYIYGKKTTGDIFTFVNGTLEGFKDR